MSSILKKLFFYRRRYYIKDKSPLSLQIILIILTLVFFTLSQTQYFTADFTTQSYAYLWTLGFELPEGLSKTSFIVFVNLTTFITHAFPVLMTFILSVILYKWAETLQFFNTVLQAHLSTGKKYRNIELFEDFFKMKNILRKMNRVMNCPLVCMIFYSLSNIFLSVYELILHKAVLEYTIIMASTFCFISGIMMMVMYTVCSSMIPEKLFEIRLTARQIINKHVLGQSPSIVQNVLSCLGRIETEEIIYISVCGMFRLTKTFILTAIGSIFTYDLLIISTFLYET